MNFLCYVVLIYTLVPLYCRVKITYILFLQCVKAAHHPETYRHCISLDLS